MNVEEIVMAILEGNDSLKDHVDLNHPLETAQLMQNILYVLQNSECLEKLGVPMSALVFNQEYWLLINAAKTAVKLAMSVYIADEVIND